MHLLQAKPGSFDNGQAIDLDQSPGHIVFLSAADTELASLASAQSRLDSDAPTLRLASLLHLSHPMAVDLYVDRVISHAQLVIVRVLGGVSYWRYGLEQVEARCSDRGIAFAALPGDEQPDPELNAISTVAAEGCHRLWQYCVHGGVTNAHHLLGYAATLIGKPRSWREPTPLPRAGIYWPGHCDCTLGELRRQWQSSPPPISGDSPAVAAIPAVVAIVFYRALMQAANTAPVDALITALIDRKINPLPLYCTSLKDPVAAVMIQDFLVRADPQVVLNALGFAVATPGSQRTASPFDVLDAPILQVIFSGSSLDDWNNSTQGLGARDLAMNVALPEVDGRIISRAVSFKAEARFDQRTECSMVHYKAVPDRIGFVADLAQAWLNLRRTPPSERRLGLILANYPNRDGRLANGVGLDTPAATVALLGALAKAGYAVTDIPANGNALVNRLRLGPTNASVAGRQIGDCLSIDAYLDGFQRLPSTLQTAVLERWGEAQADRCYLEAKRGFALSVFRCGQVIIGLQPARGFNIDPKASYHDPDLVPPHGYLAFYMWLRERQQVQAIIHMGKHGNLEWLPGKAVALTKNCFPEAVFGPLPHIYPFIVNDPGEGTQAKRRTQAVIIDHLTPPLTRAESYGPLANLERLVDEYYQAAGVDPRRVALLRKEILAITADIGLNVDCGIGNADDAQTALTKLDNYLCELKELQIRDGLHIFGQSPTGALLDNLIAALVRLPRGVDHGPTASLPRAIARDLQLLDFDPLVIEELGAPWTGARPTALLNTDLRWRTKGDTVERIEQLALELICGQQACMPNWDHTAAVLEDIRTTLRPNIEASGDAEISGVLQALNGRFVEPGPAGAPTRGRPEVLPTGRNFYAVDLRTVPTPTAWQLGWHSASLLVDYHRQQHGEWPRRIVLSAWGTANMRSGGDDIAQALALLGVRPTWEPHSGRVSGFEVLPLELLNRPRVDVLLRISGLFRDAFPAQIALLDAAVQAVAAIDEAPSDNPLAAAVRADAGAMQAAGDDEHTALRRASYRIFGAKPGAYGAGLQVLIDERCWSTDQDLARAYVAWGGYAYGENSHGDAEHALFEQRLIGVQAVLHNQDNREHDLLDSDDYYQFEGGATAAVRHFSGQQPAVYHNDHSRPEHPRIATLEHEIGRIVRARVVNPKWIAGVLRHGYKGGFELAATVDYLFAFAATAQAVRSHHFDLVYDAYLNDDQVRNFLQSNNDAALREISQRLLEAIERKLWQPRSNSAVAQLQRLSDHHGVGSEQHRC